MVKVRTVLLYVLALVFLVNLVPTAKAIDLPKVLAHDANLFDRYWSWLELELEAPANLPAPKIAVEPLPHNVRMALFYPTQQQPDTEIRIVISPRTIDRAAAGQNLEVLGELAHEVVHYLLLISENNWDYRRSPFQIAAHHHCDQEFRRLTRKIGEFIWHSYHSSDAVRHINQMVQRSCWEDGHALGQRSSS